MKLIIDTSTGDLQLGFWDGQAMVHTSTLTKGRGEQLGAWLPEILEEINISLKEIDAVLVGVGPGSFTGLRTGIAFAQGLCAVGRPLYSCSTLKLLSLLGPQDENSFESKGSCVVSIFARPGLWYLGHFEEGNLLSESMATVNEVPKAETYILDKKMMESFQADETSKVISWEGNSWMATDFNPSELFTEGYLTDPNTGVKPNYIQAPSAEVVLQQNKSMNSL